MKWFDEVLHDDLLNQGYNQRFEVSRIVCERKSEFQHLMIFETPVFGRVLVIDGVVQTTEGDEFCYHEMLAHVPMFAHGRAANVLIVGGGDGGVLREVLRHGVEKATLVDIDRSVIDACREHMPSLSDGAFDDPRSELVIGDGVRFVAESDRTFDVVIVDSTDPMGPGEVLFSQQFYAGCKKRLSPGGVLVTQNGVPLLQAQEVRDTYRRLKPLFADAGFYLTVVPTYVGGAMTLGWATDDNGLRHLGEDVIAGRFAAAGFATRYYSPAVHVGSFALPPFITALMN